MVVIGRAQKVKIWTQGFSAISKMLPVALAWTFFLSLVGTSSGFGDGVSSCFVCSGDTFNSSRISILCMSGEEGAPKAACVDPKNHQCRVRVTETPDGKQAWERSCCNDYDSDKDRRCKDEIGDYKKNGTLVRKYWETSCKTDNCNFVTSYWQDDWSGQGNDATHNLLFNSIILVSFALHFV